MAAVDSLSRAAKELANQKRFVEEEIHLAEVEGKKVTHAVEAWLEDVAQLEAEVADAIDEHKARYMTCCAPFFHFSSAAKLSRLRAEVEYLLSRANFERITTSKPPPAVEEIPNSDDTVRIGLDKYLERIREWLGESSVIGICGMGGIGKTQLLMTINNAFLRNPSKDFDFVIYLTVSRDYDMKRLQWELGRRVGLDIWEEASSISHARALFEALRYKRVLLLLDDVWERVDLIDLGIHEEHRVILTSRSESVCAMMNAGRIIRMELLSDEEAWKLFTAKVGRNSISPQIEMLAKQVAKECAGLPLALSTVGRAMASKNSVYEWQHAIKMMRKSQFNDVAGIGGDHLLGMLRLTYDSLQNDTMRSCFLSCAYWPKDCIRKDELIECWIGLGLIDDFDDIDEAYLQGYSIIGTLKGASLLQSSDDDDDQDVKMHDLIRDMALWIASEKGKEGKKWIIRAGERLNRIREEEAERWTEAEIISLMSNEIESLPLHLDCPNLRALFLRRNRLLEEIPRSFFASMYALSYLDLSRTGVEKLPEEIGMLSMLKYLNLSHTPISELPREVGRLFRLEYLHLSQTRFLRVIARGVIQNLPRLKLLDLYRSRYAKWDTEDDDKLEFLLHLRRGLKALGITVKTDSVLQRLSSSRKVSASLWRLSVTRLRGLGVLGLSANLLWNLHDLSIEDCISLEELIMRIADNHDEKQRDDVWHPSLTVLEKLHLHYLPKLKIITWELPSHVLFPRLRYLVISVCHFLSNVSWVLQLPSLETLVVGGCDEIEEVISEAEECSNSEELQEGVGSTFSSLKKLILEDLPKLYRISGRVSMTYPSLISVEVFNCPHLKGLPSAEEAPLMIVKQVSTDKEAPSFKEEDSAPRVSQDESLEKLSQVDSCED